MPTSWRLVRPVVFIALIAAVMFPLGVSPAAAQDGDGEDSITIMGTNELEALVIALRDAYAEQYPDATPVAIDPRGGQNTGFSELCEGNVDIVMSTEPISDTQIQACANSDQEFIEVVLAYEAVVLLPTPEAGLTCAAPEAVYDAWALGAPEEVVWSDLGAENYNEPVTFYGPDAVMPTATLFADLIPAGELREGINVVDDPAALAQTVGEPDSNGFGYLSLAQYQGLDAEVRIPALQLRTETGECVTASVSTLGARTYPLARTDYLYVNADSAEGADLQSFMQFVLEDANGAAAIVPAQGYTLADGGTYDYGLNNVLTGNTGRTFSRPLTPVALSTDAAGTVDIVGTAMLHAVTNRLVNSFTTRFISAEINEDLGGNTKGWEAFCQGEAGILQATREATADEMTLCQENGVVPYVLDLGYDAQVFAVPAANDWLSCMDGETAAALLRQGTEEDPAVESWNAVNADWPEESILLVAPPRRTGETDFLIYNLIGELDFPVRQDMTEDADAAYRAEGVANTDNGLTYLWWSDLQGVEADLYLPPVQGADECVAPSDETIVEGTYPLSFPLRYYVNQSAFDVNPMLRALTWYMFSDDMLAQYRTLNTAALDVDALALEERDAVYEMLAAYEDDAEATEEPVDEPAEEATEEEATEEPAAEPTEEATEEEATEEPAAEPTDEPTDEPTEEPSAEPTDEPTETAAEEATDEPTEAPADDEGESE